jgi:hypothetical protein
MWKHAKGHWKSSFLMLKKIARGIAKDIERLQSI